MIHHFLPFNREYKVFNFLLCTNTKWVRSISLFFSKTPKQLYFLVCFWNLTRKSNQPLRTLEMQLLLVTDALLKIWHITVVVDSEVSFCCVRSIYRERLVEQNFKQEYNFLQSWRKYSILISCIYVLFDKYLCSMCMPFNSAHPSNHKIA